MFFEEKSLIFQEIIDLISGVDIIISAAWGQISACFKNLKNIWLEDGARGFYAAKGGF